MSMYAVEAATYSRTPQQIANLYLERAKNSGVVLQRMRRVQAQYNGDIVVPLPEMDKDEQSFVANLVQQGLDSYGMRIATAPQNLTCPPTDPRKPTSVAKADIRRRANIGWWQENKVRAQLKRRARWYVGYASAPVIIRPDFVRGIPLWQPRNPLTAFPAPTSNPDDICPPDTIYATVMTYAQLRREYPQQIAAISDPTDTETTPYTVLEYDDAEQITKLLLSRPATRAWNRGTQVAVLESTPNRAGCPLSVIPGRITLDRPMGQFDGILGMFMMQAKLMALEVLAVQKGVFPDIYLESTVPGSTPKIISNDGQIKPGYTGLANIIEDGRVREQSVPPGFQTNGAIDRLERAQRVGAGIPADFGGESPTNIRTGTRGSNVLSSTIDFPIQEAQEMLGYSAEEENYRATKTAKAYFGNQAKSFHVNWKGAKGHVTYTPNKDFDSDYTQVTYSQAGSDLNNLVIGGGQRVGLGTMSKQSFMKIDPYIEDADMEHDLVLSEGIEAAVLSGFQQGLASGQVTPADGARVQQLVVEENLSLFKAILQAQQEAQERQASVTAQGVPDAVDPLAPAAQPGMAAPGTGAEAGAAVQDSGPSLSNLSSLLQDMRSVSHGAGAAA